MEELSFEEKINDRCIVADKSGGVCGEALGALGPAELLKRPRLRDFAQFLLENVGSLDAESDVAVHPTPCTLHPTPCTLHPTLFILHPTPYTLHP